MSKMKSRHETTLRAAQAAEAPAPDADGPTGQQEAFETFAADLGRFLGTVQNRADSWLQQRQHIAEQLTKIRDTAAQYLRQLAGAGEAPRAGAARGGGRTRTSARRAAASGRKRGRRHMSDEARARIAAAQKKRWAEYRKHNKGSDE